jgi:TctA family transporter
MGTQQFLVPGTLAGETISVMPDSGATISFLSRALAKRLDLKI